MPYQFNPFTSKMDYYEAGTVPDLSGLSLEKRMDFANKNATFSQAFSAKSKIESIDVRYRTGSGSIKIGTTVDGDEILTYTLLTIGHINIPVGISFENAFTCNFTIVGLVVDIMIVYKDPIF
jgi:hypothetical protein